MNIAHINNKADLRVSLLSVILAGLALLTACNRSEATSVVNDSAPPQTAGTPVAAPTDVPAAPQTSPQPGATVVPGATTTPAPGASTSPTPATSAQMSSVAMIKNSAPMAMPTPQAGPPAAPTPEIKRLNGKIVQAWVAPAEYAKMSSPVKDNKDAVKLGKYYYDQRCADCHGKDGLGNGPLAKLKNKQATNLASEVVQANTDGELFYKVTNTDKDRLPHPKSEARFTEDQRWYIVAYLRSLGSSGGK